MALIPISLEESSERAESFRELPCTQAFFLGPNTLHNPLLYLLHEDRQSFTLVRDMERPLDEIMKPFLEKFQTLRSTLN